MAKIDMAIAVHAHGSSYWLISATHFPRRSYIRRITTVTELSIHLNNRVFVDFKYLKGIMKIAISHSDIDIHFAR